MTDNDDIAVEGDIVDVLREWVSPDGGYVTVASDLLANAAHEIEELRALITAWADADDAVESDWQFRDWQSIELGYTEKERDEARAALRKAVGR